MTYTYQSTAQVFKKMKPGHYLYNVENMYRGIEASQNPTDIKEGYVEFCATHVNELKQYLSQTVIEMTNANLDWDYIKNKVDCLEHRLEQIYQFLLNPRSSKFTQKDIRSFANTITPSFQELQTEYLSKGNK